MGLYSRFGGAIIPQSIAAAHWFLIYVTEGNRKIQSIAYAYISIHEVLHLERKFDNFFRKNA